MADYFVNQYNKSFGYKSHFWGPNTLVGPLDPTIPTLPLEFIEAAVVVTSHGGLHHINGGIGDNGVSVVPQTLHTIGLGISAS